MKTGGRVAAFTLRDVIQAGITLGLANLTVQGVAEALGVTTAAVYRHVPSRSALESLVGEAILGGLELHDDPALAPAEHLVSFACQLRDFTVRHPGSAYYFLRLFPRGPSGIRLLEHQIAALGTRGYDPATATIFSSAIATLAFGAIVAGQERAAAMTDPEAVGEAMTAIAASALVQQASAGIPAHTPEDYFVFMLTAAATGLVGQYPPGTPVTVTTKDS